MHRLVRPFVALAAVSIAAGGGLSVACSGGNAASPPGPDASDDAASPVDSGVATDSPAGDSGSPPADSGAPVAVTFTYAPQWSGVTKVEVVGGFGQSSDWSKTASLVTLTAAAGVWTGTVMLPPGVYLYVLRVTGDELASAPGTYQRYAVDPRDIAYAACPAASPTYSKIDVNPCSKITVTSAGGPAAAPPVHVKGQVTTGGAAAAGWMVVLERQEPKSHHYFANRVTTGAQGDFDLVASTGAYRLQIQVPTYLSQSDLARDPVSLAVLRRAISAAIPLGTLDVVVPTPDVAFTQYALFAPTGDGGSLPTSFTFEPGEAHLDMYGGPGDGGVVEIGDPWFSSPLVTDGGASFDGVFTTMQKMQDAAAPGTRYMWGTEQPYGADASVAWTNQSMVFPIVWQ